MPHGVSFGKLPLISRLLKGMFKIRPSLPRYTVTYDVNIVFNYLRTLPPIPLISLKELTMKVSTLLCLLSGHRAQSIHCLHIDFMYRDAEKIAFYIPKILKNTTPTFHPDPLEFLVLKEDPEICVVTHLNHYISLTENLRKDQTLLVSHKTFTSVTSSTIGKWVKEVLKLAGVDTTTFSAHSTRSASASKSALHGLSLADIEKAGGWRNCRTIAKFYNKVVKDNFGEFVLKQI